MILLNLNCSMSCCFRLSLMRLDVGKRAGVISTARLTHASPACTFAHAANRGWEADVDLPADAVGVCPDIASQFIDNPINHKINVISR